LRASNRVSHGVDVIEALHTSLRAGFDRPGALRRVWEFDQQALRTDMLRYRSLAVVVTRVPEEYCGARSVDRGSAQTDLVGGKKSYLPCTAKRVLR
jgi:hypothetical protein